MQGLPETIRIFPLAEVVLFPGTLLPLHIFEPRYRKMVTDSLEEDRNIGMVLIRSAAPSGSVDAPDPAGDGSQAEEPPAVYPVGCCGRIVKHDPLPDGRSMIVLEGTLKFRIRREVATDEPYRVVAPQALHEPPVPIDEMRIWRDELHERIRDYVKALDADDERVDKLFEKLELEQIVNYLSASLPLDVVEKQSLLECTGPADRHRRLCEVVDFKAAEARLGMDASRDLDT